MKLGISYNLFDSEELLEGSIRYIREKVDYISVVYQKKSFFGSECSPYLLDKLNELVNKKYIDEICEYVCPSIENEDPSLAHIAQVEKRNIGLELSKNNGCTHHMCMDADEFYIPEQFQIMKDYLENYDFDSCALKHRQYYKDSIYMIQPSEEEYVIGIFKILDDTKFVYMADCVVPVDPSRKPNNMRTYIFSRGQIEMHHMSFVRKDLRVKLESSIAKKYIKKDTENIIEYYNKWEYPMPAMWAGGNLISVVQVPKIFDVYSEEIHD